jgi:hypothetical protein
MMTPMRSTISPDPFDTAGLRSRVLDAWAASPARFREDANAEEELARGAYRDRLIVELAQNATDAAVRAGADGRLLLRLRGGTLTAANTGKPLDAAGVEGLSTLRASVKRDDHPDTTVGRFGVGFAAVLAVTDAPAVVSSSGAVRWSRADAVALTSAVPELADEVARRGDAVPVLRLPLAGGPGDGGSGDGSSGDGRPASGVPASGAMPVGYDTAVVLPLRDDAATTLTRALLDGIDDGLLLALTGLAEVVIDVDGAVRTLVATRAGGEVVVTDDGRPTRWRLVHRYGRVPPELLAGRPAEEPDRWTVTVAVPVDAAGGPAPLPDSVPRVYHAPTPTDEPSALPLLTLASWPMDSSRRRVVGGSLADFLAAEVAAAYADLVTALAGAGPEVLDLVPGPMPVGELDATVQRAIVDVLSRTPFVPPAAPLSSAPLSSAPPATSRISPAKLAPRDTTVVVGARAAADPTVLARFVPGLPDPLWWRTQPLRRLGGREVGLDEVIDGMAGLTQTPAEWRELYAALDGVGGTDLMTLPVPLADGRTVRSARGVLLPTDEVDAAALAGMGLRLVDPAAVHPLLTRLGATEATSAAVLRDPAVRAAMEAAEVDDEADVRRRAEAILGLVAASGIGVDDEAWLADIWLPAADGTLAPAGEVWLPDSPVLALLDVEPAAYTVDAEVVRRWGRHTLTAVGVQDRFAVVRETDLPLDDQAPPNLPDFQEWVDAARARLGDPEIPPIVTELLAVRDLDLVSDDRWPDVLTLLAEDADLRPALVDPTYVNRQDGSRQAVPSYTAWWLRTYARIPDTGHAGRPVGELCAADADPIVRALLPPLPVALDDQVSNALGLARTLDDLVAAPGPLLDRLADADLELASLQLGAVYRALGAADVAVDGVRAPEHVRVPAGAGSRVVAAADVVVADSPQWLQLGLPALIPGTPALADVLDVDLAADVYPSVPSSAGTAAGVPAVVRRVLPAAPASYVEHDDLIVAGRSVAWWVDDAGDVHAATLAGLARGVAWVCGSWHVRALLAEAVHDPADVDTLIAERAYD